MLELGATYITVKNMAVSLEFYTQLFETPPTHNIENRWVQFNLNGGTLALYDRSYDQKIIDENKDVDAHFDAAYLHYFNSESILYGNNIVLNLSTNDLQKEYERLQSLSLGLLSNIQFVNIAFPYYFFILEDPDGNKIDITGAYEKT
jgi:lactoylglutathione lyase